MGYIDTATVTLTCPECGLTESSRVLDKGNGYSGSYWQAPTFKKFDARAAGNPRDDYTVTGKCRTCNVDAHVGHEYNT